MVVPAVESPAWSNARCNDGTPFGYALRPGVGATWVINLAGGYFCEDEVALCSDRKRRLTTARPEAHGAPVRFKHAGIFDVDPAHNPTFATAHAVDAHYCSSDLWLGDKTDRQATTGDLDKGWYFSGRANVTALVGSLVLAGLDDGDPNTQILVLGTSAGAAGVVGNLDTFLAAFPKTAAAGNLKLVLDGGWVAGVPDGVVLPNAARWGPVEPACDARLRREGSDPRRCVLGPVWWPAVEARGVPVLVQISGLDKTQTPVFNLTTEAALADWQQMVRTSLAPVPWVFSGGHPYHVVAIEPLFDKGQDGAVFRDVLDRFWRSEPPEQVFFRYP